jgi:hypothetical protein
MKNLLIILLITLILLVPGILAIQEKINIRDYEITYSYNSEDANEGDRFTLTVNIMNNGNDKKDISFSLEPDSPFDTEDDDWEIGNLSEDNAVSHNFRIDIDENTPAGKYRLDFNIKDSQIDEDDRFDIEVASNKPELIIGNIDSSPKIISADEKNIKLDITIENTGGADATFSKARLILPEGLTSTSSYSDYVNLGTIASKGNKLASFYLDSDVNIESGKKQAKLVIEYKEDNDNKIIELSFDIPIKSKPIFEVTSVKTVPEELTAGGTGQIYITIKNIGEEQGKETSIRVFENSDYPFTFDEKTKFIGTINPGESGTAIFSTDIDKSGNENIYMLNIQTRTLNNNDVLVSDETIPIKVIENKRGNISLLLIIGLIISIILVLILIYFIYVTRKKHKIK